MKLIFWREHIMLKTKWVLAVKMKVSFCHEVCTMQHTLLQHKDLTMFEVYFASLLAHLWVADIDYLKWRGCRWKHAGKIQLPLHWKVYNLNSTLSIKMKTWLCSSSLFCTKNCSISNTSCGVFSFQDYVLLEWTGMWYNTIKVAAEVCTLSWYPSKEYLLLVEIHIGMTP